MLLLLLEALFSPSPSPSLLRGRFSPGARAGGGAGGGRGTTIIAIVAMWALWVLDRRV